MKNKLKLENYFNIYTFLILNSILTIIFNSTKPRVFSEYVDLSNDGGVGVTRYFPVLSLFAILVIYFIRVYASRGTILNKSSNLILSLIVPSALVIFINLFLSTKTEFNFSMLMFLFAMLTLSIDKIETKKVKKVFYLLSIIYIVGSGFVGVFRQSVGLEYGYSVGYLPWRLHGIAALANHLAPILVSFIIISISDIASGRISRRNTMFLVPIILIALSELILTQSKTTMISAAFWVLLVLIIRYKGRSFAGAILKISFIIASVIYARSVISLSENIDLTLTGRDKVWDFVIREISVNPYFGYGVRLWDTEMRENFFSLYFWYPGQSHNHWIQILGQAGIVGLLLYIPYLIILTKNTLQLLISKHFAISILPFLLLTRSITESNMLPNNLHENYLLFILSIMLLVSKEYDCRESEDVMMGEYSEKI